MDGVERFFYAFKAIKLTKWRGRGGYLTVSVLVLPGLALGNGVKHAFSLCQVEPNSVLALYIRDSSWKQTGVPDPRFLAR